MGSGASAAEQEAEPAPSATAARAALLLYVLLLPLMRPALPLLGYEVVAADAAYLLMLPLWIVALAVGAARLRWHPAFWLLGAYFAAMALSCIASPQPAASAAKLATQAYLLSLPPIVLSLVRTTRHVRALVLTWLAASAAVAALALPSLVAFLVAPDSLLGRWAINDFGTLPPGDYPRLRVTFGFAAMLCNYMSVSLMLLLVARRVAWVAPGLFLALLAGYLIVAAFTITPGLGGLILVAGIWFWAVERGRLRSVGRLALGAGLAAALAFLAAATVTPFLHSTAPFLIEIPGTGAQLAPSVRLMAWIEAARTFAAHPLVGQGIGIAPVDVRIVLPSGQLAGVDDAHNSFLNIAAQCGLVGLAALLALVGWAASWLRPLRLDGEANALRVGLALAFLGAFAWQGLVGAFEDARHLWLLFGLIVAVDRLAAARQEERAAPRGTALP